MPRHPKPLPPEKLTLEENLALIIARLQSFTTIEPLAQTATEECQQALELLDKVIRPFMADPCAAEGEPVVDLPGLQKELRLCCTFLETMLNKQGQATKVIEVREQRTGIASVAQGLIEIARELPGPAARYADKLEPLARNVKRIEDRVAAVGDSAFQDEIANAATELWLAIDTAWDVLGICLRRMGIFEDPVYVARPTTETPLRRQVTTTSPKELEAMAEAPKKAAKKGKVAKKKGAERSGTAWRTDDAASNDGSSADGEQELIAAARAKSLLH